MTALRYLLDEHMSRHLAAGLRRRGVECITVAELGKPGTFDRDHLAWAQDEAWVEYSLGQLIERLQDLATSESMESIEGRVHYL